MCAGMGSFAGCIAIQDNVSYFYDVNEEPMDGWDFVSIWDNGNDGVGFPVFKWQVL